MSPAVAQELVMYLRRPGGQSQFSRHAPAAFVMRIRVEEARRLIETGAMQLKEVARRCSFKDEQGLRRGFLRLLGVTPHDYRLRFTRDPYAPSAANHAFVD
jgi:AraC-like DNA-binding protein